MKNKKQGFSLIELAVVLVIIGLLIGGVTAGLSLKRGAQLQAVVADFGRYKQAANSFKEKYYYWPGDHPSADGIWTTTANGNGNNKIGGVNASSSHDAGGTCAGAGNICTTGETYYAFDHLNQSDYISFNPDGAAMVGGRLPEAPIDGVSGMSLKKPVYILTFTALDSLDRNVFSISDLASSADTEQQSGGLYPDVSLALDKKIDDSFPTTGYVRGINNATTSTTCRSGSAYDVADNNNKKCIVSIILDNL